MSTFKDRTAIGAGAWEDIVKERFCRLWPTVVLAAYKETEVCCSHHLAAKVGRLGRVFAAIASLVPSLALLTACATSKPSEVSNHANMLLTNKAGDGSSEKLADGTLDWPWPPPPPSPSCSAGQVTCYRHYECCDRPLLTQPVGIYQGSMCWSWSSMSCQPCSNDCAAQFPSDCGQGNCYNSCIDDPGCSF